MNPGRPKNCHEWRVGVKELERGVDIIKLDEATVRHEYLNGLSLPPCSATGGGKWRRRGVDLAPTVTRPTW